VDRPGQQLLFRPAFSLEQYGRIASSQIWKEFVDLGEPLVPSHLPAEPEQDQLTSRLFIRILNDMEGLQPFCSRGSCEREP
jgi:hypothetical protein